MAVTTNAHTKGDQEKANQETDDQHESLKSDATKNAPSESSTVGGVNKAHREARS